MKILVIFGTRPELIKLAPVISKLGDAAVECMVCVTAQHREMVDSLLGHFGIVPDFDLDVMRPDQELGSLTASLLNGLGPLIQEEAPDWVVVQGDTTTALAGALAAYYARVPIAHVEAGLRTGDLYNPFPEEANRRLIDAISKRCFAPTTGAARNLEREGVPAEQVLVTGNTGIDSLHLIMRRSRETGAEEKLRAQLVDELHIPIDRGKLLLVTGHRRESFGAELEGICSGLRRIAESHPEVTIVYPVHFNPHVREPVRSILGDVPNVVLTEPLNYPLFVELLRHAYLVLTDSGGVQEEAPALAKPVLVLRHKTERPEAIEAGVARLVGTDPQRIVDEVDRLLTNQDEYQAMARGANPYGDGHAAERIVEALLEG